LNTCEPDQTIQRFSASGCRTRRTLDETGQLDELPDNYAQSLQLALVSCLGECHPGIQSAAGITGLTVRTLQRHLNRQGLTYRERIDQIRFQTAMRLVEDDRIRLGDLAQHVGYSGSAHFNRALRRWTGNSPAKYPLQRSADR